jgi:hypothetical protein
METEQDTCSMEEEDMEIYHLENTDSNQQENIEIDQENSENTQPEKESVSTNKGHFQPGVFAAHVFLLSCCTFQYF